MKGERTMAAEINNIPYKIYLSEDEMPKAWYNVRADMKVKPAPLLNLSPGTGLLPGKGPGHPRQNLLQV